MKRNSPLLLVLCGIALPHAAAVIPLPDRIPVAIPDQQDSQVPDRVRLSGWIGARVDASERNRLVRLEPARLLEGFRQRPGRQVWDGEHVGKWLHAGTLAWVNTGDPSLRAKLDLVATELCRCQLADGYLGTYLEQDRWTEWDVWVHKYDLIGLLTYSRYTGNPAPLSTCRRIADLLCRTFGDGPGQRDIIQAGWHAGMAPTSVLEPMVVLYRLTGEPRYLDFCRYLLRAWEQPGGPRILSTLLAGKGVDKVGNAKAYEMLSCLNGVLELYRTTGDRPLLDACLNAWKDIVDKRLYVTGAASYREYFHEDYDLPNADKVGETCVTVTWLQLNAQLLRLTGESRFAEQLERVILNQLFGAQRPDGTSWGYFVQMEGQKPYADFGDVTCCQSSGPRGVALIPTFALTTDADGVIINLFAAAHAALTLRDGWKVALDLDTGYPADGVVRARLHAAAPHPFAVKLRIPDWCPKAELAVNGQA
ncbi:MAG TPA: beta-L-arabinofuranosidase domain-containing protein, partial [Opitutaceae bacterium]|nr:beta-L-arabinofuranosidase domain-containing protein [Opitutaceae bacterium]